MVVNRRDARTRMGNPRRRTHATVSIEFIATPIEPPECELKPPKKIPSTVSAINQPAANFLVTPLNPVVSCSASVNSLLFLAEFDSALGVRSVDKS